MAAAAVPATAQDTPAPAPPAAVAPAEDAAPLTSADLLAFAIADSRMTVPVTIAGAGPYRFVIDTGAQRTVISRELAHELGLAGARSVRMTSMTGVDTVGTVMIPSIRVSTLGGEKIEAPALSGVHLGAPGMLGIDALQGHALAIDFDTSSMAVTPSSSRLRPRRTEPNEIVVQARSLFGQLVVTDATCNGQRVRVVLDTGSPVSMGNEALRKRVLRDRKAQPIELTGVTGASLTVDYTALREIKLGDLTIQGLPIAFADLPPFKTFGMEDKPAILLGMDALRMFRRVRIDFANRELRLLLPRDTRTAI